MGRRQQSILEILMHCPWWVNVIVSAASYIGLAVVLPTIEFKSVPFQAMANGFASAAGKEAIRSPPDGNKKGITK